MPPPGPARRTPTPARPAEPGPGAAPGTRGGVGGVSGSLTVQRQHGWEVLAVGDAGRVGHAGLPEVGPKGGGGDDRAIDGGHLPVVGGQRGGDQHPS